MSYGGGYDPYTGRSYGMAYGKDPVPENIMENLLLLKWYGENKLADTRLTQIAFHLDDPQWIKDKEEEWLNEPKYWNGHYGCRTAYEGSEWE